MFESFHSLRGKINSLTLAKDLVVTTTTKSRYKVMLLVGFMFVISSIGKSEESLYSSEQRLIDELLGNYSVNSRPIIDSTQVVKVYITTKIVRIDTVSEKSQSFRTKLHVKHEWHNPLLSWKQEDYGGVDEIIVPVTKIWSPYIHLFNEAAHSNGERFQPDETYMILLTHDGNCSRSFSHFFKSTCEINVSNFPFDEQFCDIIFGSWSHDHRMLRLIPTSSNATSNFYAENGEWELTKAKVTSLDTQYGIQSRPHSVVHISVHIKRKYFFFVMNLVLPCALIACMIFLVFLLPPKSGERISLGITVLLSMAIFQELSSEKLPSSSDNFPLLGIYYTTSMFEIGIAMTMNCFVLNLYYRNYDMPMWVRRLILGRLARLVRVDVPQERTIEYLENTEVLNDLSPLTEHHAMTTVNENKTTTNGCIDTDSGIDSVTQDVAYYRTKKVNETKTPHCKSVTIKENSHFPRESLYKRNLRAFSVQFSDVHAPQAKKQLGEDWRLAARIVDRVMLVVSIVTGVVSALTIFMQAKRFREMVFG